MTTCVVALGQPMAGDDGVGLVVLEQLRKLDLPPGVELHALRDATALIELVRCAKRVIIVDALLDDEACGTVRVVRPEELETAPLSALSAHGLSVGQAIALARLLAPECACDLPVVAIAISRPRALGTSLSETARAALPRAVEAIRGLLGASTTCIVASDATSPGSEHPEPRLRTLRNHDLGDRSATAHARAQWRARKTCARPRGRRKRGQPQ